MNDKMCETIVQSVQQGGTTAIWLYAIYILGGVTKFLIGFGCVGFAVVKFCKTWRCINEYFKKED